MFEFGIQNKLRDVAIEDRKCECACACACACACVCVSVKGKLGVASLPARACARACVRACVRACMYSVIPSQSSDLLLHPRPRIAPVNLLPERESIKSSLGHVAWVAVCECV